MFRHRLLSRIWLEWLRPLLVVGTLLGSFRSAVADWNDVPSGSMEPTILVGDRVFVNKVAYDLKVPFTTWRLLRWGDPKRGDVVVLWSPHDGRRLVKRVVGLPGDRIEMRGYHLRVNREPAAYGPLAEDVIRELGREGMPAGSLASETLGPRTHPVMAAGRSGPGSDFGPVIVPPGHYFLMGDHRDNSFDSRFWGFAERGAILGRASAVVLSLDYQRFYRPRWRRFLSPLP
jgi:signal peptidase I